MKKFDEYTFGNTPGAVILAKILDEKGNKKIRNYVESTLTEYNTFLKDIFFIKEKNPKLAQRFAYMCLQEKVKNIKKSIKLTQEIKNFTCNVLRTKYRIYFNLKK